MENDNPTNISPATPEGQTAPPVPVDTPSAPTVGPTPVDTPSETPVAASEPAPAPHRDMMWAIWAIVGLVIACGVGLVAYAIITQSHPQADTKTKSVSSTSTQASSSQSTAPSDTDNASLNQDLNSINSSLGQGSSDQSAANNALNDQQNEIAVPTN